MNRNIKKLCFAALFAALCAAATFISVPLPFGYFNLGDVVVLACGILLGPAAGAVSAGVGSALADIFMGYAVYAPATLIIKALVAFLAAVLHKSAKKLFPKVNFFSTLIVFLLSESVMVAGYFAFESLVLGYGLGALASIAGNVTQAVSCSVLSTILMGVLSRTGNDRLV